MPAVLNLLTTFTLTEPLGVEWRAQLLCQRVTLDGPLHLKTAHLLADGVEVPFQATEVEANAATLWFWCDLPAHAARRYELVQGAAAPPAPYRPGKVREETLTLANPLLRLNLTGSHRYRAPREAAEVPGPIQGYARPGQAWLGGSRWETRLRCTGIVTEITESGLLWTEARITYTFEHGASYAMTVRLYTDRDYAVIDERMALRFAGRLLLDLSTGWKPDHFYVRSNGSTLSADGHSHSEPIPTAPNERLREIQMPAIGTYYVSNITGYLGLFMKKRPECCVLAVVGLDGDQWESAIHNRMRIATRAKGEVVMEMPVKAGRRRWALALTESEAALVTAANAQSSLLALRIRQSDIPLREVLAMQLSAPNGARTLLFTDAIVQRARTRLLQLPAFRASLDAVLGDASSDPAYAYLMTGERHYAEQTRGQIRAGLRDMLGRLLLGGVTDGSATTIALSRSLRAWIGMLDLIRHEPDILDNDEGREIERLFLFFAHLLMSERIWPHRRTALHHDHPESQKPLYSYPGDVLPDKPYWINCLPNFQSDWLIALASIGLAYPAHPQSGAWVEECLRDQDAQLDAFVFPTGGWVESMNYALYTLNYYAQFFLMLKEAGLRDYFADARMLRWLDWHTRMLTPPDPRIGGLQTQAYVGNAILPDGQSATFNWYAQHIPDRELAGRLVEIWRRAGSPPFAHPGPRFFEALLDPDQPTSPLPQTGSTLEPGFGAILRAEEGTPEETFLTFKVGAIFSHYEGDELSFHWHARGVPLCSEYGVYQPASAGWDAHNLVEVPALDYIRRGYLADAQLDESADYLVGDLPGLVRYYEDFPEDFADRASLQLGKKYNYLDHEAPLGPKIWLRRAMLFIKPHYLVLLDDVDGVTPARFNLHCVADRVAEIPGGLNFTGRFGMDLTAFVLQPASYTITTGQHAPVKGEVDHSQLFARIIPKGANHFRTVLYPHRAEETVRCRALEDGVGTLVTGPCGLDRVWLTRETVQLAGEGYAFTGSVGWVRAGAGLHLLHGRLLAAEGLTIAGDGPAHLEYHADGSLHLRTDGPARRLTITDAATPRRVSEHTPGITVHRDGAQVVLDVAPGVQTARLV